MVDLEKKLEKSFNTSFNEQAKNLERTNEELKQNISSAVKGTYQRVAEQMVDLEKRVGIR